MQSHVSGFAHGCFCKLSMHVLLSGAIRRTNGGTEVFCIPAGIFSGDCCKGEYLEMIGVLGFQFGAVSPRICNGYGEVENVF